MRNPWLRRMFLSGAAPVLIGLIIVVVEQARKTCFPSGRCGPEGFTSEQILGLGLVALGAIALIGWMAAAAVCWQLDRRGNR